ncbi:DUF3349 domain-containing protein [Arsenicicoccus dermatophilus]|uniref:DUF3349 domain-containing protein n=1 Tax=Arsenicicoccus dermatophilus TaxID=1076331 RepID=UPI0039175A0B
MNHYLERVISWLRAGYPDGVPATDYQPMLALLRRRLSDSEVEELGQELVRRGLVPADHVDVGVGMTRVTAELPSHEEMIRVSERLLAEGFPVAVEESPSTGGPAS